MPESFELGGEKWNVDWFKKHTVEQVRKMLPHKDPNQVTNVWKQINGKTVKKSKEKEENKKTED